MTDNAEMEAVLERVDSMNQLTGRIFRLEIFGLVWRISLGDDVILGASSAAQLIEKIESFKAGFKFHQK